MVHTSTHLMNATFYFGDVRPCVPALGLAWRDAWRIDLASALVRLGLRRRLELPFLLSQILPEVTADLGADIGLTLTQTPEAGRRGRGYVGGEVTIPGLGTTFRVTPEVFVPRPEGVLAVERILATLARVECEGKTFWDMGCGSGFFAVIVKQRFPALNVIASDINENILAVARENAERNHAPVRFTRGDLFQAFEGQTDYYCFYAPQSPRASWDGVSSYSEIPIPMLREPLQAFQSGPRGMELLDRVCGELPERIRPGGTAWLLLGGGRHTEVVDRLAPSFDVRFEGAGDKGSGGILWAFTRRHG